MCSGSGDYIADFPRTLGEDVLYDLVRGKIAYFDDMFHQVIAPKYDWGSPFEAGRALVCIGCQSSKPDEDGHVSVDGVLIAAPADGRSTID
jgi:hypothetical protein